MSQLQVKTLTFKIVTKADQPLEITPEAMDALVASLDRAAQNTLDMRYGNRYEDKRHEYIGVML